MKIIGSILLAFGLFQCASVKFDKNPPFTINNATYNKFVGGMPGSSGTTVNIEYTATTAVEFDSLFFQGKKTKINLNTLKKKTFIKGYFNSSIINSKEDLILHSDGKKEFGNKPPQEKIPFTLKDNEAVISYVEEGKKLYFKIENIKKEATEFRQ